jgi:hypothetical protein
MLLIKRRKAVTKRTEITTEIIVASVESPNIGPTDYALRIHRKKGVGNRLAISGPNPKAIPLPKSIKPPE